MQWLQNLSRHLKDVQDKKTQNPSGKKSVPDHDSALAHRFVEEQEGVLIDVRSPAEYAAGHLQGAINLPVQSLAGSIVRVTSLTGGKRPVVVYCASGMRSGRAKKMLTKAGIEMVTNLGAMSNW